MKRSNVIQQFDNETRTVTRPIVAMVAKIISWSQGIKKIKQKKIEGKSEKERERDRARDDMKN